MIKYLVESSAYNEEHGEQKMEPFNLRQERGEGYFDQFLNYHKTKSAESDPYWKLLDEDKEKDEFLFNRKYHLRNDIIEKHKKEYQQFENAKTDINLLNEWKSLLPLFQDNKQTITNAMQSLSKIIKKYDNKSFDNKRPTKKRKLNDNKTSLTTNVKNQSNEKDTNNKTNKKKKRKRAWEIESDDETKQNDNDNDNDNKNEEISSRELMGYKTKFELFSEKATMLFANGDHNIYQQTRNSLIERIKLVEDEQLFKKQKEEAFKQQQYALKQQQQQREQKKKQSEKEKLDDMLADFSDQEDEDLSDNDLVWFYYWKHDQSKEKHGPFSDKQMLDWNDLYFKTQPIMFKHKNDTIWINSDQIDLSEKIKQYIAT